MSLEIAIQIVTLLSVIVGFAGLILTINFYRRQMNAEIVMKYGERFERMMDLFPEDFLITGFSNQALLPAQNQELTLIVIKYLNLCVEEYYLYKKGYMAKEIWQIWEPDIKRALRSPLIKREWESLKKEYESYSEFYNYVEKVNH